MRTLQQKISTLVVIVFSLLSLQAVVLQAATTAPTLVDYQSSSWTDGAASEVTPALTWSSGNVIVCVGGTRGASYTLNTPTASGLTFSPITSASGNSLAYAWSATAGSSGSGAVTATTDGVSTSRGLSCFVFSGSDGIGTSATIVNSSAKTISLTRASDNSAVVTVMTDWNANANSAPTLTPAGGTQRVAINVNNIYSGFVFNWDDQGAAGTTSYGMASYTGTPNMTGIAVEIKGTAGGGGQALSAPVISSFTSNPSSISNGNSAVLSWSVSGNPAPTVSIDNGLGTQAGTSVSVSPAVTTTYTLTATNSQGNVTAQSTVTVATQPPADTTPPSTPVGLSATAISSSQINLSWTASTDNVAVTGYKIFRGGVQIGTSATNNYSDSGLSASTNYSYTVSAYDAAGNNSAQSSSASATTQAQSGGQTVTANSCSFADVQAAVNAVSRNGTVNVPAGSCTWNSTLSLTKGITLKGAGVNNVGNTTITTSGGVLIQGRPDSTAIANSENITITGFTFDGGGGGPTLLDLAGENGDTGTKPYRYYIIGNNTFQNTDTNSNNGVIVAANANASGQLRGVIYNNIFDRNNVILRVFSNNDLAEWQNSNFNHFSYGTEDSLFFENNTIKWTASYADPSGNAGWIESGQGARLVVRYNNWNFTNVQVGGFHTYSDIHGFQNWPGGQTGTMNAEYYGNTWTSPIASGQAVNDRSSQTLFFNNLITDPGGNGIDISQVPTGCPAYTGAPPAGVTFVINNTYAWNNTLNGSRLSAEIGPYGNNCGVAENAAWWTDDNPSCTASACSSGIGRGTTPPTGTCTTGVGYWVAPTATPSASPAVVQNGALYKCTSTNTWSLYYTPYTYPHPLASGIAPPPDTTPPSTPTGLSAVAISSSAINLSWTASTDNVGVSGYKVFRNGTQITTTSSTSYSDTGLSPSTTYSYTISAYDAAGNSSSQSTSASATTQASATPIPGDLNLDHIVNTLDFSLLNSKWLQSYSSYDLFPDGIINSLDYAIMSSNWGKTW